MLAVVGNALASSWMGSENPNPGILGQTTWKVGTFSCPGPDGGLQSASIMRETAMKLSGNPWTKRSGIAFGDGDLINVKEN